MDISIIPPFFMELPPIAQALLATGFTWFVTALGAATVFLTRGVNRRLLDGMLGFAAGVMIAASYWSLLAPAIEQAESNGTPGWLPAIIGFLLGAAFLRLVDIVLPHLHITAPVDNPEGIETTWRRTLLLVFAVALHNFPEGLAVGVAFGAAASGDIVAASVAGAVALSIGIGLQNFPEGIAISMPLRREGVKPLTSFMYGQLSGFVEVIAGLIGVTAVLLVRPLLPYALAFAAGAMIFVVVEDVIPDAMAEGHTDIATTGAILGFTVMMFLDVALG